MKGALIHINWIAGAFSMNVNCYFWNTMHNAHFHLAQYPRWKRCCWFLITCIIQSDADSSESKKFPFAFLFVLINAVRHQFILYLNQMAWKVRVLKLICAILKCPLFSIRIQILGLSFDARYLDHGFQSIIEVFLCAQSAYTLNKASIYIRISLSSADDADHIKMPFHASFQFKIISSTHCSRSLSLSYFYISRYRWPSIGNR